MKEVSHDRRAEVPPLRRRRRRVMHWAPAPVCLSTAAPSHAVLCRYLEHRKGPSIQDVGIRGIKGLPVSAHKQCCSDRAMTGREGFQNPKRGCGCPLLTIPGGDCDPPSSVRGPPRPPRPPRPPSLCFGRFSPFPLHTPRYNWPPPFSFAASSAAICTARASKKNIWGFTM